jgi:hypothetical protein
VRTAEQWAKELEITLSGTTFSGSEADCNAVVRSLTTNAIAAAMADARRAALQEAAKAAESIADNVDPDGCGYCDDAAARTAATQIRALPGAGGGEK